MSTAVAREIDARGLNCPLPILKIKKALAAIGEGEIVSLLATDPGSVKDVQAFCKQTGNELLSSDEMDGAFQFLVKKH